MIFKSALITPIIPIVILIVVLSVAFFSLQNKSKDNNQSLVQKDIEITQLKEQVELLRGNRNNTSNDNLSTAVEVVDLNTLKGNSVYPLKCFRSSQGDDLDFSFLDEIDIQEEDILTICEIQEQNNYLIVTFNKTDEGSVGRPYAGIFSFKIYSPKDKSLKEIAVIGGGLYSWCDDINALTKDNQLFVKCTDTIYKIPISS